MDRGDLAGRDGRLPRRRARGPRGCYSSARRGALQELLGAVADRHRHGLPRPRRVAVRFGLDHAPAYRVAAIAPLAGGRPDAGTDRASTSRTWSSWPAGSGTSWGRRRRGPRGPGPASGCRRSCRCGGGSCLLARDDWAGLARFPNALDATLGGPCPGGRSGGAGGRRLPEWAWVAVGPPLADGAGALAGLLRGRRRRRPHRRDGSGSGAGCRSRPTLPSSGCCWPSATSPRRRWTTSSGRCWPTSGWGPELVETLQVYFDAGENMREAAGRFHLANRTVAYRLARIEGLAGRTALRRAPSAARGGAAGPPPPAGWRWDVLGMLDRQPARLSDPRPRGAPTS